MIKKRIENLKSRFGGEQSSFKRWMVFSTIAFVVIAVFFARNSVIRLAHTAIETATQKREIRQYKKQIEIMQDSIDMLKHDPEFLEKYAREKHHFADSSEDVYIVK